MKIQMLVVAILGLAVVAFAGKKNPVYQYTQSGMVQLYNQSPILTDGTTNCFDDGGSVDCSDSPVAGALVTVKSSDGKEYVVDYIPHRSLVWKGQLYMDEAS